jgi:type IV secretory pathway VirB2 component (pilin)
MGDLGRALLQYLKQVVWVLALVYVILLGIAVLFGRQIGFDVTGPVVLGIAGLVTAVFIFLYVTDALRVVLHDRHDRRRKRSPGA